MPRGLPPARAHGSPGERVIRQRLPALRQRDQPQRHAELGPIQAWLPRHAHRLHPVPYLQPYTLRSPTSLSATQACSSFLNLH